jgi:hypothetical protein
MPPMNSDLQNDIIEFKAWYQHRMELIDTLLVAAGNDENPNKEEIAQLRKSKLILIEKSARMIVEIYSRYGFYPDR